MEVVRTQSRDKRTKTFVFEDVEVGALFIWRTGLAYQNPACMMRLDSGLVFLSTGEYVPLEGIKLREPVLVVDSGPLEWWVSK